MDKYEDNPQLYRYQKLLTYLDEHLHEVSIERVEKVCHYSYRNINRIFEAIHHETIGKYVKRLRLEKGAQFLKYSDMGVSQIAYKIGFEDRSAFSKAFRARYGISPKEYREDAELARQAMQDKLDPQADPNRKKLDFEVEYLPDFEYIFFECQGYQSMDEVEKNWHAFVDFIDQKDLLSNHAILMTEITDDDAIGDQLKSRYGPAMIIEKPLSFQLSGPYRVKSHQKQKYAKFIHQGSAESLADFYRKIYAFWMTDVSQELIDSPILEFYPNFEVDQAKDTLLTEIYIAIA